MNVKLWKAYYRELSECNDRYYEKILNLCHVLRDDGITYLQYVTEQT
ncbi:MAG: hypothetical protein AB1589_22880 [Cyanobacteriota bacterium]